MFLGDDRLPIVREMILADTPDGEAAALEKLRAAQRSDFVEILEAMDGLPVTRAAAGPAAARVPAQRRGAADPGGGRGPVGRGEAAAGRRRVVAGAEPHARDEGRAARGGQPGLYAMQVRALMEAALDRAKAGGKPVVEIMIPLTVTREEMEEASAWVTDAIDQALKGSRRHLDVTIGTMIETPRAALVADEIAEVADFFSFGTNDLTQMTFGFSRDDVESRMMPAYLAHGLLRGNPFESIDEDGVGDLVNTAVERVGRPTPRSS